MFIIILSQKMIVHSVLFLFILYKTRMLNHSINKERQGILPYKEIDIYIVSAFIYLFILYITDYHNGPFTNQV